MPRLVDLGVTKVVWVPGQTGITDPTAPSAAAITAGEDISPFLVTSYTLGPTASDTVNDRSITDTSNRVTMTVANYEGSLVLFRDFTAGKPTPDVDLLATFTAGSLGWVVRRVGVAAGDPIVATDVVEDYLFMCDYPQVSGGSGEGFLRLTVNLLQQGTFAVNAVVAA